MNPQEIFNTVVNHLRNQNSKALNEEGSCCYRGCDGKKCAIGCLITDEEYSQCFEGVSAQNLLQVQNIPDSLKVKLSNHHKLLQNLQNIHDSYPVQAWESQFKRIAQLYSLNLPGEI